MRSSFFEFHVAVSGLFSAQAGLQTVAHNTANAATPGFSRQVAQARATQPLSLMNGRGMVGTGSAVFSIMQMRDVFLDRRYWGSTPTLGQFSVKRTHLMVTQTLLSELEGTGLVEHFNNFFDALQNLTTWAGDGTHRTAILMQGDSLSTFLLDTHEALLNQQRDVNEEIVAVVSRINSIGNRIATLNDTIRRVEVTGDNANDLRDQRALLVDELSRLVNIDAYERDFGDGDRRFFVRIDGQDFVMHNGVRNLTVGQRQFNALGRFEVTVGDDTTTFDRLSNAAISGWTINGDPPPAGFTFYGNEAGTVVVVRNAEGLPIFMGAPPAPGGNFVIADTTAAVAGVTVTGGAIGPLDVLRNDEDNAGLYNIYWGNPSAGIRFNMYSRTLSGELKGLINLRDGNNGTHGRVRDFGEIGINTVPGTTSLTMSMSVDNLSRLDLSQNGGVIRVVNSVGHAQELIYDSFVIDSATGMVTFSIAYRNAGERDRLENYLNQNFAPGLPEDQQPRSVTVGQTTDFKGIPYYINRLNTLARTFAAAVNFGIRLSDGTPILDVTGHVSGLNRNGQNFDVDPNNPTLFFTHRVWDETLPGGGAYRAARFDDFGFVLNPDGTVDVGANRHLLYQVTARNFAVNARILEEPSLLNAAGPDDQEHGVDNNITLLSWLRLASDPTVFREGRILDFIIGMTGELAIDIKQAQAFELNYMSLTTQINMQRMAVSGVDINEEMVNMIRLNQQFQAAGRLINVIDGIYDMLVNRLGLT